MFFESLVAAGLQLLCVTGAFAIARTRTAWRVIVAILAGLIGMGLLAINEVLLLHGVAMAVIGVACTLAKTRKRAFAGWAAAASIAILGVTGSAGVWSWVGLKERYPFESMSPRLAYEEKFRQQVGLDSPTLTDTTRDRLKKAEERGSWSARSRALRLVHANYVEQFIASPGFGVGRRIPPSSYHIEFGDKRAETSYPLESPPDLDGSSADAEDVAVEKKPSPSSSFVDLDTVHDDTCHDFLDPGGFGYFRDRDHMAGFVPHGFLKGKPSLLTGGHDRRWLTIRVDLVSLLKHERPMAYVSEHLPNMTELGHAPVRELDEFEQSSLSSLMVGEDLVSEPEPGGIRALGSLRATRQCLDCHQVERGTLLGAFSYEFLRDPPVPRAPARDEKLL